MFRLVVISSLLLVCGTVIRVKPQHQQPDILADWRIIGGVNAEIENLPYQLSLQLSNKHYCGASVISAYYAITAAHCTVGRTPDKFTLRAGSGVVNEGGDVYRIEEIIQHNQFDDNTLINDIALLKLRTPFIFNSKVRPITVSNSTPVAGTSAIASGWGFTTYPGEAHARSLQKVKVFIVDHNECLQDYKIKLGSVTKKMLCAGVPEGGKDACQKDSGGPLQADGRLVGLVSWGKGCGLKGFPGVYTDIASFRDFIQTYVNI